MLKYLCLMENEFAAWLLDELKKRDWNQSDLSQRSGISQGAISKVLLGQRKPGLEFCVGVAKALRIPSESIFRAAGLLPEIPEDAEGKEELDYLFNTLSDEGKNDLLIYARFLLAEEKKPA